MSRSGWAWVARLLVFWALAGAAAPGLAAQQPPDSLALPDTIPAAVQTEAGGAPQEVADSLEVRVLPVLPGRTPEVPGSEVWIWDRDELLGSRALTLLELLEEIGGVLPLRYGDYGAPEAALAPGLTGGRLRVFFDGFEALPLDGSVPDLSRIALGSLSDVRAERVAGELRVYLRGLRPDDPRPLSVVEAGTGDLGTNLFRGTFVHPRGVGGSLALSLERLDTRGSRGQEEGSRRGLWLRYGLHRGEGAGLAFDLRRSVDEWSVAGVPPEVTRTDWAVRGRLRLTEDVVAEAFTGRSSLSSQSDGLTPVEGIRRQHGLRLGLQREAVWARLEGRVLSGPDVPSWRADASVGGRLTGLGGAVADGSFDRWEGRTLATRGLRLWTEPRFGVSLFASAEAGERGARSFAVREILPPPDTGTAGGEAGGQEQGGTGEPEPLLPPAFRVSDVSTLRLGARVGLGPLDLTGSWLRTEADSVIPTGLLLDRGANVLGGDRTTGFEVGGRLRLPLSGFSLVGSLLQWDQEGVYRPKRIYHGGIDFHDSFLPSGNLEIRGGFVVEGRDPMLVPAVGDTVGEAGDPPAPLRVPFSQSWNAHVQIRVLSVRIFIRWDNVFLRAGNQDFPERVLPRTRTLYGVRWTLFN